MWQSEFRSERVGLYDSGCLVCVFFIVNIWLKISWKSFSLTYHRYTHANLCLPPSLSLLWPCCNHFFTFLFPRWNIKSHSLTLRRLPLSHLRWGTLNICFQILQYFLSVIGPSLTQRCVCPVQTFTQLDQGRDRKCSAYHRNLGHEGFLIMLSWKWVMFWFVSHKVSITPYPCRYGWQTFSPYQQGNATE